MAGHFVVGDAATYVLDYLPVDSVRTYACIVRTTMPTIAASDLGVERARPPSVAPLGKLSHCVDFSQRQNGGMSPLTEYYEQARAKQPLLSGC